MGRSLKMILNFQRALFEVDPKLILNFQRDLFEVDPELSDGSWRHIILHMLPESVRLRFLEVLRGNLPFGNDYNLEVTNLQDFVLSNRAESQP